MVIYRVDGHEQGSQSFTEIKIMLRDHEYKQIMIMLRNHDIAQGSCSYTGMVIMYCIWVMIVLKDHDNAPR
jgi:hypothetical protein